MNDLKIESLQTADLVPYARNSRTHSAEQVRQIANSIKEFGFTNPVLIDWNNGIIAGHGRVMAAELLGLPQVPCIRLGYLSDAQRRAYVIADNQLALNSGWDFEILKEEMAFLNDVEFDIDLLGFDDDFLNNIGFEEKQIDEQKPQTSKDFEYKENYSIIITCENEKHQNDVFDKLSAAGYACKVLVN